MEGYKRTLFMGIILIALRVVFSTTLSEKAGSLGIVFIATGGLLFIIGMSRKKEENKETEKDNKHLAKNDAR